MKDPLKPVDLFSWILIRDENGMKTNNIHWYHGYDFGYNYSLYSTHSKQQIFSLVYHSWTTSVDVLLIKTRKSKLFLKK